MFRRLILEKIPFLLLGAAAGLATILAQQGAMQTVKNLGYSSRIGNALVTYAAYLGQMLYPSGLAVFYPHPRDQLSAWTVGLCVVVLTIITAGVMRWQRKRPYLLVGWLWYLGMLVPVIGILQVGSQAHADRYTYLPHIGLYVMVAWGIADLCAAWRCRRGVLCTAAAAILAASITLAHVQTTYWHDSISLWTRTLAYTSGNYRAHNNLGAALARQWKWDEAIQSYERALQLKPDLAETHANLGSRLAAQGKSAEAMQHFQRALSLATAQANPALAEAIRTLIKTNQSHPPQANVP